MINDAVKRFIFDNHGARGEIVQLDGSLNELIHENYPAAVSKTMMELAVSAVLIAATLKDGSEIMLQLRGGQKAPLKYAIVNIRQDLSFYGSAALKDGMKVSENCSLGELTGEDAVLVLSVFPKDGPKWQGIVAVNKDSVSATFEDYFRDSQQLATRFFIHTDPENKKCGGIMLQIIPEVEGNLDSLEHLSILSATLTKEEMLTLGSDEILSRLFAREDVRVFNEQNVSFRCICSKQRCEDALSKLSYDELKQICEDKGTSMTCQHCSRTYTFTEDELKSLLLKNSQ